MEHPGRSVAWGQWAITNDDPEFRGRGASDSGEDYHAAPGVEPDFMLLLWHTDDL